MSGRTEAGAVQALCRSTDGRRLAGRQWVGLVP